MFDLFMYFLSVILKVNVFYSPFFSNKKINSMFTLINQLYIFFSGTYRVCEEFESAPVIQYVSENQLKTSKNMTKKEKVN
jgi:hypothetical protein